MTNEITQYEEKKIILMKSGLIHWVSSETGDKMSEHLANQSGHSFLRIKELGNITINTAEVEAVYNHQQYTDLCRVKSGEWQCSYGKWHPKKGECQCKSEYLKEQARKREKEQQERDNRPLTPEEQERNRESFVKMGEMSALDKPDSIFGHSFRIGNKNGKVIRRSTIAEWEEKNGRKANLAGLAIEKEGGDITNNEDQHDNA